MKKVIELLETAKELALYGSRSTTVSCIEEAIAELKALPRWETPEQREKRTGEAWPENWAVYALYENNDGTSQWFWGGYKKEMDRFMRHNKNPLNIVCATEAGPPPDDWRPEELRTWL
jgi:hypothetical protein